MIGSRTLGVMFVVIACSTVSSGCRRDRPTQPSKAPPSDASSTQRSAADTGQAGQPPSTPLEAMQRMAKAYAAAPAYSDEAVVTLAYGQGSQTVTDTATLHVAMNRRDNLLRVKAYQVDFCVRQGRLRAKVNDAATNDMDHQALDLPAPTPITLEALNSDPVLSDLLNRGMARSPIQLELLYGASQLDYFLNDGVLKEWAPEETIAGQPCYGVAIGSPTERFVFWIDKQSYLLRRLDYPTTQLARATNASGLRLTAEFHNASFSTDASRFDWQPPGNVKFVNYFVPPPQPLPTSLYGKAVEPFEFLTLDGKTLSGKQLEGKPAVLVWFSQDLACRATLQQVSQVQSIWPPDEVSIYAVCTEGADFSDQQLQQLVRQWRVSLPVVRDLKAFGRDVFEVPSVPALAVLNKASRLQVFDVGFNQNLPQELDVVLRMLKDGKDVAAQVLQRAANEQATYRQDLVSAGAKNVQVDFPVAPRREPSAFVVEKQWTAAGIKQPGGVITFAEGDQVRTVVLDGLRTVTVVDEKGEVVASRELDLPANQAMTILRTQVVADQRWYLALTPGGDQVALFDAAWQRSQLYPQDPLHEGILDAALIPSNEGVRMLVGYRSAGLHGVDADGRRRWSSRDCNSPLSIDVVETGEGWRALATDPSGQLYVITPDGQSVGQPIRASGWPLYEIAASHFPHQEGGVLCGVSYDALGQRVAVGLDLTLTEQWRYSLPGGAFASPMQAVVSGTLMDQGCWLLAAPDGSLHLLSADGKIQDQWNYGKLIRGIAINAKQQIIVSTNSGVDCWSVSPK